MAGQTREEIDAKLAAVEARLDAKLARIEAKLDVLTDRMAQAIQSSNEAKGAANEAKDASNNVKWNILFTALGVIATIFVMWSLWAQAVTKEIMSPSSAATDTQSPQDIEPKK